MPFISDWKPSDPYRVLVFSKHKMGKTWGACTFPRPVMFDFDKGAATARNPEFVNKFGLRWMFYETFEDTKRSPQGVVVHHTGFDESCKFFDEWMKPKGRWKGTEVGRDMFETFVIDSGTMLSELAMNKAVIVLGGMKLSHSQEKGVGSGLLVPTIQDFGAERSLVEQFVRMLLDSGKNIVFVCHEKEITDASGATTDIVPLLTGKSAQVVPLMFDEVYNLRIKQVGLERVRYLQTQADAQRRCGSRYGIPNETTWDYNSLRKEIDRIHSEQQKQVQALSTAKVSVGGAVSMSGQVTPTVK